MNALRALILGTPIAILAAIVVACGPGNNGPVAGVLTAPGPTSSLTAFSASGSVPLSSNLGVPIALPSGGGVGGTLTIPSGSTVPAGTVLSGTLSSRPTAGAPTLSSIVRSSSAVGRIPQGEASTVYGLLYGQLSLTNAIVVNGTTSMTFTFPAGFVAGIPSSFSVYVAMYDPTRPTLGWLDRVISCTTSTSANSITCTFTGSVNIPPNVTYGFALYAVATNSASPTPAPSVSIVAATPNPNQVTYTATANSSTIVLPSEGGISGTLNVPAASASPGTTITGFGATSTSGAFLPALSGGDVGSIIYVGSLTPSAATTFPAQGTNTLTFKFGTGATLNPNGIYELATYDATTTSGWFFTVIGPGVVNTTASTITFATPLGIALKANSLYGFALYLSTTQPIISVVTSSTSGSTWQLPTNSAGIVGSGSVSAAATGGGNTLTLTVGSSIASPIPTLALSAGSVTGVLAYGTILNTGTTNTAVSTATLAFTLPSAPPTGTYFLAFYDTSISPATGWFLTGIGPGSVSGNTIVFSTTASATFQPSTKATYGIALYYK